MKNSKESLKSSTTKVNDVRTPSIKSYASSIGLRPGASVDILRDFNIPTRPSFIDNVKIPDKAYDNDIQSIDATRERQQNESLEGNFSVVYTRQPMDNIVITSDVGSSQQNVDQSRGAIIRRKPVPAISTKFDMLNVDRTHFEGIRVMIQDQLNNRFSVIQSYKPDQCSEIANDFTNQVLKQLSCLKPYNYKYICNTVVYQRKPKMSVVSKSMLLLDNNKDFVFTTSFTNERLYADCVVLLLKYQAA
ncbi:hypothetical protein GJ496_000168 [Pomphorhynchus laevis]|nr:hypothetical protein GJ496_000168 [Pomphorhynchus laevis]